MQINFECHPHITNLYNLLREHLKAKYLFFIGSYIYILELLQKYITFAAAAYFLGNIKKLYYLSGAIEIIFEC